MKINSIRFSPEGDQFSVASDSGFSCFNCNPLKEIFRADFKGSISLAVPLFRCIIVALVADEKNPAFALNKSKSTLTFLMFRYLQFLMMFVYCLLLFFK